MAYSAIEGSGRLYANLEFLERYFGSEAQPITMEEQRAVAYDIRDEARRLAPRRTGELQSKIEVIEGSQETLIVSGAKHSLYVEFGTVRMAAQPFFRPAYHKYSYFQRVAAVHRENLKNGLK